MSRIGKQPISIPSGVAVSLDGNTVSVKGPKGELSVVLHPNVTARQENDTILITVQDPANHRDRALWGLSRVLINNMIVGVTAGYSKQLEIQGIGFRVQSQGKTLIMQLGFSHPVEFPLPDGIEAKVDANIITLSGINKHLLGETAAQIRALKKPEPYKGKGIRYVGEAVRRKAGKVVKGSE